MHQPRLDQRYIDLDGEFTEDATSQGDLLARRGKLAWGRTVPFLERHLVP